MTASVVALLVLLQHIPDLRVEAPPDLAHVGERISSVAPAQLADVSALIGGEADGPPIRVVLAAGSSEWARRVPPWTAGFAVGGELIVLFPARAPIYPHGTLEDVLRHELAHVLIARASGGRPVPRWFNEGLAMAAERPWGLADRTRLAWELAFRQRVTLIEIDRLFAGDREDQTRAYAVAGWFVSDLLNDHGSHVAREVLARMARGLSFDRAFAEATGLTLVSAEGEFWDRQRTWTTWVPLVTSTSTLWLGIALLAVYAARRRRQRRAALHRRWAEEEAATDREAGGAPDAPGQ